MAKAPYKPPGNNSPQRRVYSISTVLMAGFGALIFLGVAGVFLITMWSARENTFGLLADKIELTNSAMVNDLRRHLEPVRNGSAHIAAQVSRGEFNPKDQLELSDRFTSAMAVTPQILGMAFISAGIDVVRVRRGRNGITVHVANESGRADLRRTMDDARRRTSPYWGRLVWSGDIKSAMIDLRSPLRHNGKFLGMLVSVVSMSGLSELNPEPERTDAAPTRFVLYGNDHVLAHGANSKSGFKSSSRQPLPRLDQIGDPIIARIWDPKARQELKLKLNGQTRGHLVVYQGDYYPIFYRRVAGYGKAQIIVGAYVRPGSSQGVEMRRLAQAAMAAGFVLFLVVVMALVLGRWISRPVRELAIAARRIGELDFSQDINFKNTRMREFADAAGAFNSMMAGLRWFETYVPRKLARRIIKAGGNARIESAEHDVTVMFTDIARFAGLAENLSAAETADLLNEHFSLLAECIEAEDGTLDKFIGDSVMAFWAPPLNSGDHITSACRAALAIRETVARGNRAREERGDDPIRVRMGVHTGPAIVGNIGAPGRINYTVVGDTVNLAQRLEELGKTTWGAGEDSVILVSGDVADALGDDFELTARGSQEIRGRDGGIRVFRLDSGKFNAPGPKPDSKSDPKSILELTEEPLGETSKRPDPPVRRDLDQAARAYNPAIKPPTPAAPLSIGPSPTPTSPPVVWPTPFAKPGAKTATTSISKPVATPVAKPVPKPFAPPIGNTDTPCPPIEPAVAPPGSPAANRYAAKDPKGYDFDWDLDGLEADKKKDDDTPDQEKP